MAFVRDDHSFTRGPGAIAAIDAVSSRRRRSMARAERALALREALTQGAIDRSQEDNRPSGPGGSRPPRPPRPTGGRPTPTRPPFTGGGRPGVRSPLGVRAGARGQASPLAVKLPGSVITPEAGGGRPVQGATGSQTPATQVAPATTVPVTPIRVSPAVIVAAPGIAPIPQIKTKPTLPPMPWDAKDEVEQDEAPEPTPEPAPPKTSSKLPLYAGLGLLALLLAR